MKNKFFTKRFFSFALLGGMLSLCTECFAVDPCEQTTKLSGGTSVTSNGIKDIGNGFNYELWRDGSSGSMTVFGGNNDCAFKASWNNSGDFLARVGYYYGGSNSKTYKDLSGDIHAEYNYSRTGTAGSYSYIGIYGWTNTPQIEYYIVDDSWNGMGTPYNTSKVGSYTVDGATYTLYKGTRTNAPSITGTSTFTQVFAVRSSARSCGHISVSEHFKNWEKNGISMGGLYDCKLLCEAGGGTGSIEYTYATMWLGDYEETPVEPKVPQAPYGGTAWEIPGTVEAENYDVGGNGFAYSDTDSENEGDADYRTDEGVDVVSTSNGKGIGYTTDTEWLEYTVNIKTAGKYNIEALASNGNSDFDLILYLDDKKIATISGNQTTDWDTYSKCTASTSDLSVGEHILKVEIGNSYTNLDYIKFYLPGEEPAEESKEESSDIGGGSDNDGDNNGNTSNDPGVYPLRYDVENTGANCEDPSSLNKNNLKTCKTLPSPFEWADGNGSVTNFCEWSCRRNEIKREIEFWEIGEKPTFDKLEASYSNGTLTVKITNGSNILTLTSKISIPSGNGPHPIVIGMDGNTGSLSSSYFSKCIQVPFTHSQIAEYNSGLGGSGRSQSDPFYQLYPNTFNTKADYCAWSWGISRLIDGLEIVKDQINADLEHIAVTGCSYAGKMALYAGAFDERVALTIAQESGGGGINSWRVSEEIGSDVEGISNTNYDWFLSSFKTNFNGQTSKLPYDHHELIAMIAPRAFLAFGNPDYTWLGDKSGYISLKAAEEVWTAMGIEDRFGYVIEGGHSHCQASNNQNDAAQKFINKFLYGDNSQNTTIRTSTVTADYSSYIKDWSGHNIVNEGCGNSGTTNVEKVEIVDRAYVLNQNNPNPVFGNETDITFSIPTEGYVIISIYNSLGVKVNDVMSENVSAGSHSKTIDVRNLSSGIYFITMNVNGFSCSKCMIVK